jgi:hypothetical protein
MAQLPPEVPTSLAGSTAELLVIATYDVPLSVTTLLGTYEVALVHALI